MAGFDYVVEYKKGVENEVANALSRRSESKEGESEGILNRTVTTVESSWLEEVRKMIDQSLYFQELQERAAKGTLSHHKYKKVNGIWFYKERSS